MSEPGHPTCCLLPCGRLPGSGEAGGRGRGRGGRGGRGGRRINAGAARRGRNGGAELGSTADSARARPLVRADTLALTPTLALRGTMAESHLQSPLITASQFFEIWLHFDADGDYLLSYLSQVPCPRPSFPFPPEPPTP